MEKISIIGSGTMGHSIALGAAWVGQAVNVYGVDDRDLDIARRMLGNKLQVMVENNLFEDFEAQRINASISFSTSLEDVIADATFLIEAIPEVLDLKWAIYKRIEGRVKNDVIIASNTSGFKPTVLASKMDYPNRFVVTHFWNPAHLIPLVEVVRGEKTDEATVERTIRVLAGLKKKPVLLKKEIPGFIGNRLQWALFREAQALLDDGVATREDIDAVVTHSIGRRLGVTGPLLSADLGGLDVVAAISDYLFRELSSDQYSGETLARLVEEKKFGNKSGEGFYRWDAAFSEMVNAEREKTLIHFLKMDRKETLG